MAIGREREEVWTVERWPRLGEERASGGAVMLSSVVVCEREMQVDSSRGRKQQNRSNEVN